MAVRRATGFRFTPAMHVRKEWEFRRAYRTGGRAQGKLLSVVVCPNRGATSRLGLSVSRKVGGAVRRNKIKRLIREAFRLTRWEIEARSGAVDVVVIPQQSADKLPLADLMQELPLLVERAAEKAAARGRAPRRRDDRSRDDRRSGGRR